MQSSLFVVGSTAESVLDKLFELKRQGEQADYRVLAPILTEIMQLPVESPECVVTALDIAQICIPHRLPRYELISDWNLLNFGNAFDMLLTTGFLQYVWCRRNPQYLDGLSMLYHTLVCYGSQNEDTTCETAYQQALSLLVYNDQPGLINSKGEFGASVNFGICQMSLDYLSRKHPRLVPLLRYLQIRLTGGLVWPDYQSFTNWKMDTLRGLGLTMAFC